MKLVAVQFYHVITTHYPLSSCNLYSREESRAADVKAADYYGPQNWPYKGVIQDLSDDYAQVVKISMYFSYKNYIHIKIVKIICFTKLTCFL